MTVRGDGDGGDFAVTATTSTPKQWWSAFDRAAGPALGGAVVLNLMDFAYEVDTSPWWASVDGFLALLFAVFLVGWYVRGRDQDRVAARSWMVLDRTFRNVDYRGFTVTIVPGPVAHDIVVRLTREEQDRRR
jgi:hypothetical protein